MDAFRYSASDRRFFPELESQGTNGTIAQLQNQGEEFLYLCDSRFGIRFADLPLPGLSHASPSFGRPRKVTRSTLQLLTKISFQQRLFTVT
jgi:hypothetical protein